MEQWLVTKEIPHLVAATKVDKLKARARAKASRTLGGSFGGAAIVNRPIFVSAETGVGTRELWNYLDGALEQATDRGQQDLH